MRLLPVAWRRFSTAITCLQVELCTLLLLSHIKGKSSSSPSQPILKSLYPSMTALHLCEPSHHLSVQLNHSPACSPCCRYRPLGRSLSGADSPKGMRASPCASLSALMCLCCRQAVSLFPSCLLPASPCTLCLKFIKS